ncbi:hypothetical protein ZYGR_0AZ01090 [Zygosaccharomyces rouxii]|uniref:Histone deacetylase complex subunit SAP30 Sin3 binding domain-containing protein n=1 Tax=Zygosaccharomyces rouxii TaxID=4956 RepID=A0A1Q3AJM1_ZYGRO|nr:hypothetical protein ZYGR_0AZ01090 [Zygosaccharomyces rouxii]
MPRTANSNSESESNIKTRSNASTTTGTGVGSRSHVKQRLTTAQQQYLKDLVRTHVTNNHPDLTPKPDPMDFESYSDDFLRRYKDRFQLNVEDHLSIQGYLVGSQLGSKTHSSKRNKHGTPGARIVKKELASEVKRHFNSYNVKETECIPQFIYKVKTQKKKFKMWFKN